MKKVLVTGGTGFIGSALVKRLVDDGYSVRVLDNNSRGSINKLGNYFEKIEFIEADVRDYTAVKKATQGVETIFHLAFINGTKYFYTMPEKVLEIGIKGAIHTLDAVIENGVKEYILVSSSEIYQQPTTIPTPESERAIVPDIQNPRYSYGGSKLLSELMTIHYAKKHGFRSIIVRPHNVYGPDMGYEHVIPEFFKKMQEASDNFQKSDVLIEIQGSGTETRAFDYIDDFINGMMLCYETGKDNEIYHIGNDKEEISIITLLHKMAEILQLKVSIKQTDIFTGSTTRRCPNINKLRSLGFEPKVSLDKGLRKTLAWYKSKH
jgi:nucleoside-diphosphate-sugar epimerase